MSFEITAHTLNDRGFQIVPASSKRAWMDSTHGHAPKCLPLLTANQIGWHILCPCDVTAVWNGNVGGSDIKLVVDDPSHEKNVVSHFGHGIVTFQIPYLFRTSEKIAILARGATNFWVENAQALDGLVETYWSNYTFTMNWKILKPCVPVTWRKGNPICMLQPFPIDIFEGSKAKIMPLAKNPPMAEAYAKWSKYRDAFNNRTDRKANEWQKDYFVGRKCPFSGDGADNKADPHVTKFDVPPFEPV